QCSSHLFNRNVVAFELAGIDDDVDGAAAAADEGDGADAVEAGERVFDLLVSDFGNFADGAAAGNGDGHDRRGVDVELIDDGRIGAGGQAGEDGVDLALHLLLGHV